jgi:hypothetical protein
LGSGGAVGDDDFSDVADARKAIANLKAVHGFLSFDLR